MKKKKKRQHTLHRSKIGSLESSRNSNKYTQKLNSESFVMKIIIHPSRGLIIQVHNC